ncbi:MAG: hypothetical protein ACYTEU_14195 [Planctomycetota bacterium]|jgi:hypothetical protein
MTHADKITKKLEQMNFKSNAAMREKTLSEASQAMEQTINAAANKPSVRRIIMKTRITKFAAAAIVLIAIGLSITLFDKTVAPAYGLTEALQVYKQTNIIHMKGLTFFFKDTVNGQESCGLPFESWIDQEKGRFRELRPAGSFGPTPNEIPRHYLTVSDGRYLMETSYLSYLDGREPDRTVKYVELSPFQQRLQMRTMQNFLGYFSVYDVSGFSKIGCDTLDGGTLDIWQGEVTSPGKVVPYKKLMVWVSPTSGEIRQIYRWSNALKDENEIRWRLGSIISFEYDMIPPENCFDTIPPPGCELENTKETALNMELGEVEGDMNFYGCIGFTLGDGTVIFGWHANNNPEESQALLFENLRPGGPLPQLPAQITSLIPYPAKDEVSCIGHHFTYTRKQGKFYEWGIYVPNGHIPKRYNFKAYKIISKYNNTEPGSFNSRPKLVGDEIYIDSEQEFNTWVLGAMGELSDDGKGPENITYDGVLKLAQQIRESLDE